MNEQRVKGHRLIAVFMVSVMFFNYPLLMVFNQGGFVGGIPVLYLYLFLSWGIVVCLTALVLERAKKR